MFTEIILVDPEMPAAQELAAPHCQLVLLRLKKPHFLLVKKVVAWRRRDE